MKSILCGIVMALLFTLLAAIGPEPESSMIDRVELDVQQSR